MAEIRTIKKENEVVSMDQPPEELTLSDENAENVSNENADSSDSLDHPDDDTNHLPSKHSNDQTTPATTNSPRKPFPAKLLLVGLLMILIIALLGGLVKWFLTKAPTTTEPASEITTPVITPTPAPTNLISGTVTLTGLVPDASASGEVHIFVRPFTDPATATNCAQIPEENTTGATNKTNTNILSNSTNQTTNCLAASAEFIDTQVILAVAPTMTWQWTGAERGQTYEIVAGYVEDGATIKYSPIDTVTAPALEVQLDLNLAWLDVPDTTITELNTQMAGQVKVNGYIPANTTLTLAATPAEKNQAAKDASFSVPWENGQTTLPFSWDSPIMHVPYRITATLTANNNNIIGVSESDEIAQAGDSKLALVINSKAVPPTAPTPTPSQPTAPTPTPAPQKTTLYGTVVLNGPVNAGSSILILVRPPGYNDYTAVGRIFNPDNSRQTWSWADAEVGKTYEVMIALQVDDQNTSTPANGQTVTAPASDINFRLNTNFSVPTPNQTASAAPCVRDGDKWRTTLVFPAVANAGNYWVQVGSSVGFSDVLNNKFRAPKGDFSVTVRVDGGHEYFARYGYTYCVDCENDHNFSPFSTSLGFTCS